MISDTWELTGYGRQRTQKWCRMSVGQTCEQRDKLLSWETQWLVIVKNKLVVGVVLLITEGKMATNTIN